MQGGKRPGAGRKPIATKKKRLTFALTDEMQAAGLTSSLVREIIKAWIDLEKLRKASKPYDVPDYYRPILAAWRCQRCGIKLDGAMGYVCGNSGCPAGLGGPQC